VPALANSAPRVHVRAALRASLLPCLANGLFDLCVRCFLRSKPHQPRLVGLLHRTLRVNAANGIAWLATDRTKMFGRLRNNDDGFFAAHVGDSASDGGANGRFSEAGSSFFLVCRRLRFSSARCFFSISRRRFSKVFWFFAMRTSNCWGTKRAVSARGIGWGKYARLLADRNICPTCEIRLSNRRGGHRRRHRHRRSRHVHRDHHHLHLHRRCARRAAGLR
jgi:hypothetical protein